MALLTDYMTKVSTDHLFQKQYKADAQAAMADFGLSQADQNLLLDGDTTAIQKRLEDAGSSLIFIGAIN